MQSKNVSPEGRRSGVITPEIIERLESLFEFVEPNDFREYLIEIFHSYILHEHHSLPHDFKAMTESFMIFMDFLKFTDEEFGERAVLISKSK